MPVVFVDANFFTRSIRRDEMLFDTQAAIRIDAPGKLDPEFILLPNFARIGFISKVHPFALSSQRFANYRLTKSNP